MNVKKAFKEKYKRGYSHMAIRATMHGCCQGSCEDGLTKDEGIELEKLLQTHTDQFNRLPLKFA
jgi:hypothetical protein